jgi:hypothetical protein
MWANYPLSETNPGRISLLLIRFSELRIRVSVKFAFGRKTLNAVQNSETEKEFILAIHVLSEN